MSAAAAAAAVMCYIIIDMNSVQLLFKNYCFMDVFELGQAAVACPLLSMLI